MKLTFIINEATKSCDTYIAPDRKFDDDTDIDAILASTQYGNSTSDALGVSILNFATWINHGDVEVTIGHS